MTVPAIRPSRSNRPAPREPWAAGLGASELEELDRRLGAWQRRRVLLYFAIAAAGMILSAATGTLALPQADPLQPDAAVWRLDNVEVGNFLDTLTDAILAATFVAGLLITLPKRRTHRGVVATLQVVLVIVCVVAIAASPFVVAPTLGDADATIHAVTTHVAMSAAAGIFLLHFTASALVALSPREALRPLLPIAVIFAAVALLVAPISWPARLAIASLGAVAGIPGLIWSVARYRRFQERFAARTFQRRVEDIDRDLQGARRLHEALLPQPIDSGPVRIDYRYEPMREIGGDFLTIRHDAAGRFIAVVVDVTGHGIAAALAVNRLHGELDRLLAEHPEPDPGLVLAALNRYTVASLAPQGIYATAFCVRIAPDDGLLEWSNAGHPPAFLIRSGHDDEPLASGACMLGVLDAEDFVAPVDSVTMRDGDRLLAYTDGASEAFSIDGRMFGIDGIRNGIWARTECKGAPAAALVEAITRFRAGPPRDDLLAVDITYVGTGAVSQLE